MANHEQAVRDAGLGFKNAVADATAAGFRVDVPRHIDDFDKIAISETAKLPKRAPLTRPPVSTLAEPLPDEEAKV